MTKLDEIKELLATYNDKKREEVIFGEKDEKIDFLEKCLDTFEKDEKDLVLQMYAEQISVRKLAKMYGISRYYIVKTSTDILGKIVKLFQRNKIVM